MNPQKIKLTVYVLPETNQAVRDFAKNFPTNLTTGQVVDMAIHKLTKE